MVNDVPTSKTVMQQLAEYAEHRSDCQCFRPWRTQQPRCTCGLNDLLAQAQSVHETTVALTECPYCKRPAAHDESIYHAAGCAGMERMFITRLEYDRVRGAQKTTSPQEPT